MTEDSNQIIPPKHCPDCGGANIDCAELWHRCSWKTDPSNPAWQPYEEISYDVWCSDCETSFEIFPIRHSGYYWYDAHPEDVPEEGNTRWNEILAQRLVMKELKEAEV